MNTETPVTYGYWFATAKRTVPRTNEPLEVGRTYRQAGPLVLCQKGLHGSIKLRDALSYASSSILTRCSFSGEILHGDDKLCATERTVLWIGDIEPILHEAACIFAEGALRVAKVTDPRSWAAIEAKRKWLRGEITAKELAAAGAAAWDAARDAARDAAGAAARAAAWDAARDAAGDAARDAAGDAARAAARAAARDAAWDAARDAAGDAVRDAVRDAARDAAWDAARAAARDAQNDWLECAVRDFAGVD